LKFDNRGGAAIAGINVLIEGVLIFKRSNKELDKGNLRLFRKKRTSGRAGGNLGRVPPA